MEEAAGTATHHGAIVHGENPPEIIELSRQRADTGSLFDKLKDPRGLEGFCGRKRNPATLAAGRVWLTCNQWTLLVRPMGTSSQGGTRRRGDRGGNSWFWRRTVDLERGSGHGYLARSRVA